MYNIKGILKTLVKVCRLLLRRLYLVINVYMRCLIQYQVIQHFIKPRHKTHKGNISANAKGNTKSGSNGLLHLCEQMCFCNTQYHLPVNHSSGLYIFVFSSMPDTTSTLSMLSIPKVISLIPFSVCTLFSSIK